LKEKVGCSILYFVMRTKVDLKKRLMTSHEVTRYVCVLSTQSPRSGFLSSLSFAKVRFVCYLVVKIAKSSESTVLVGNNTDDGRLLDISFLDSFKRQKNG
jgi:hypothetical protein